MSLNFTYKPGETLEDSYFIATDGNAIEVVRASKIVPVALHAKANANELDITEEDYLSNFREMCPTLDSFKRTVFHLAANNVVTAEETAETTAETAEAAPAEAVATEEAPKPEATSAEGEEIKAEESVKEPAKEESVKVAAAETDAPMNAIEEDAKVKKIDSPVMAAEEGYFTGKADKEGASDVKKFYGRLPSKSVGAPANALDLQSRIQALAEELQKKTEELDGVKKELDGKKKEGEAEGLLELLDELGVIEDPKDREVYKKKLAPLPESAMGILENILKDVRDACEEEEEGEGHGMPKMPKAPMAPKKPAGPPPAMKGPGPDMAKGNILSSALMEDAPPTMNHGWGSAVELANIWGEKDRLEDARKSQL